MKSETTRQVAERIAQHWFPNQPTKQQLAIADIVTALNAERERAAKIIQGRIDQYALLRSVEGDVVRVFGKQMIEAIRGTQ